MGNFDNPVIRLFFIFAGGFTLAQIYIQITGYLPGNLQWFPFGAFPTFGSIPYITVFLSATLISGILWWFAFFMHGRTIRRNLVQQGVIQK